MSWVSVVGLICKRCRHYMEIENRGPYGNKCPECLGTEFELVTEPGPTERQAAQLLTGQEP